MSLSKSQRLLYILEAVESLGVAVPATVLAKVAGRLSLSVNDANLKRAVYRDLKSLADGGRLAVRMLTAEGLEIDPDHWQEHKNLRTEYRLAADAEVIGVQGMGLIQELGGEFVPAARKMSWSFQPIQNLKLAGHLCLIMQGQSGRLLALQLPVSELPCKILISRVSDSRFDHALLSQEIQEQFGLRTACFFTWDASVSRHLLGQRPGHALLTVQQDSTLQLEDLNSSTGTSYGALEAQAIPLLLERQLSSQTQPEGANPLRGQLDLQPVKGVAAKLPGSAVVQFGSFRLLLHLPSN